MKGLLLLVSALTLTTLSAQTDRQPIRYRAEPLGGNREMKDFIKRELVHPVGAPNKEKVKIGIALNDKGIPEKLWVIKGVSKELKKEASRIAGKILWHPAKLDNFPIPSIQYLRFKFKRTRYLKWVVDRGYDELPYVSSNADTNQTVFTRKPKTVYAHPVFKDTNETIHTYITDALEYPETAKKFGIQGRVMLTFIVEPSGNPSNFKLIRDLGGGCNEETIRLIKSMRWVPSMSNDVPFRTRRNFTMHFKLPDAKYQFSPTQSGAVR